MLDLLDRVLLLKNTDVFSDIKTENLTVVAKALEERHFQQGTIIFEENDYGDEMFIIVSGEVGILKGEKQTKTFLAQLTAGECFGEMGLLDDRPRSASVQTLQDTHVLSLEKDRLRTLVIRYPELAFGMLKSMSARLRHANDLLEK